MKKILLILIAFAPIFAMAQFEGGEYINSDTLKNKGVNVYVDHLKNFVESDSGKILMHRNKTATWENLSNIETDPVYSSQISSLRVYDLHNSSIVTQSGGYVYLYIPSITLGNEVIINYQIGGNTSSGEIHLHSKQGVLTQQNCVINPIGLNAYYSTSSTAVIIRFQYGTAAGVTADFRELTVETKGNYYPSIVFPYTGDVSSLTFNIINKIEYAWSTKLASELGGDLAGNRTAYIDLHGDDTYADYGLRITRQGSSGANSNSILFHRGKGGLYLYAVDAGFVTFFTKSIQRGVIDSVGNWGIGTISPLHKLHVSGNILADTCFTSKNSSLMNASNYYVRGDSIKAYVDRKATGGSGMTWPSTAGIANYAGSSAWGTSITTSAGLSGVLTDETGSGSAVFATSPTIASPTVSTSLTGSYLTASTLLSANASKQITSLSTTYYPNLAEIAYVKGVTSSIQSQLDSKGTVKGSGDTNNQLAYWTNATTLGFLPLTIYPTLAELSYVKGVTSSIQTQINAKQATLVSGTNLKTVNGNSLLGSGDLSVSSQWNNDTYGITYASNVAVGSSSRSDVKIYGYSTTSTIGVYGNSSTGVGVEGVSGSNYGIYGASTSGTAVSASSSSGYGVHGVSGSNYGGVFAGLGVNISSGGLYISGTTRISSTGVFTPSNGASGSFKSSDNKTITVTNGIITSITTP